MSATADLVELFDSGRYADLVAYIEAKSLSVSSLPVDQRPLVALSYFRMRRVKTALSIAAQENSQDSSPLIRSQYEVLLGLWKRANAEPDEASAHFNVAVRLGKEGGSKEQTAWAYLHLLRTLAELRSTEELAGLLSEARAAVIKTGNPHIAAYLHNVTALIDASAGRIARAQQHIRVSASLLGGAPHAALEQLNLISSSFLNFHDSQFKRALTDMAAARALVRVVGREQEEAIDLGEAHALLTTGRLEPAVASLQRTARSENSQIALASLDSLAQAYLVSDRVDDCAETLDAIALFATTRPGGTPAMYGRWTPTVSLKLLMRQERWEEAATQSEQYLSAARKLGDSLLVAALTCLRAEALAGAGRHREAAQALFDADIATAIQSRMGGYFRSAGVVLRRAGYSSGQAMFARAKAIWDEQENRYELIEAQAAFKAPLGIGHTARSMGKSPSVVNSLASVFSLARSPRLVGRELVNIIEALGCADDVTVADGPAAAEQAESAPGLHALSLGEHRGKPVQLRCRVPADPQQALLLSDIFRITRAALELEQHREAERDRAALWTETPAEERTGALFISEEMQSILGVARRIATTNVPVLITGETGTGKEVLARVVHAYSSRAKAAFVPFNCTSTPKDMLDSQLFGHRRGSFTGAMENFPGIIRGATGGTLFLDEIGDMGIELQPKLLRFLDSHEVHPIGETQPVHADVRVIAATNADLDALVSHGRVREDLYYRLNIVRFHLPPLRERRVEIPSLVNHYLQKFAREYNKGDLRLSEETMEYLILYRWPGNVRQLANEIRRMAVMAETGAVLMPEHLTADILGSRRTLPPSERVLLPTEVVVRLDQPMAAGVEHVERSMVLYALKMCGGRIDDTAKMLGLSRKGLYLKRQRFGIDTGERIQAAGAA